MNMQSSISSGGISGIAITFSPNQNQNKRNLMLPAFSEDMRKCDHFMMQNISIQLALKAKAGKKFCDPPKQSMSTNCRV